jgi:hypothetical protein
MKCRPISVLPQPEGRRRAWRRPASNRRRACRRRQRSRTSFWRRRVIALTAGSLAWQPERATGAGGACSVPSEPPQDASLPDARTARQLANAPSCVLRRRTPPTSRPKLPRSKTAFPSWRTSPRSGGTGARPPRSFARSQPSLLDKHTPCANRPTCMRGTSGERFTAGWVGAQRSCDSGRFYSCRGCHRGGGDRSSPRSLVRLTSGRQTKAPTAQVAAARVELTPAGRALPPPRNRSSGQTTASRNGTSADTTGGLAGRRLTLTVVGRVVLLVLGQLFVRHGRLPP